MDLKNEYREVVIEAKQAKAKQNRMIAEANSSAGNHRLLMFVGIGGLLWDIIGGIAKQGIENMVVNILIIIACIALIIVQAKKASKCQEEANYLSSMSLTQFRHIYM